MLVDPGCWSNIKAGNWFANKATTVQEPTLHAAPSGRQCKELGAGEGCFGVWRSHARQAMSVKAAVGMLHAAKVVSDLHGGGM